MKFLKLLDPRDALDVASISKQARLAKKRFPELVAQSKLRYWRPGMPYECRGRRLLLGLAVSFSLPELRLADVINDAISRKVNHEYGQVDVFDIDELASASSLLYFGKHITVASSPVASVWVDGKPGDVLYAFSAIQSSLQFVEIFEEPTVVLRGLRPPDVSLMED